MIYLDHAAATPVRKEVLQVMQPYFTKEFANPSSIHEAGQKAREAIEKAREKVRKILNADAEDKIIFTSGGTESINLAIQGMAKASGKKAIITSGIEHEAVLACCGALEKEGKVVERIPVNRYGIVKLKELQEALHDQVALVSIIYANNEVGTIQPLQRISAICKGDNYSKVCVLFHSDACQAGHEELDVQKLGVDLLTLNGSKIYGPKGVGILYVRKGIVLEPLLYGGGQEYGLRSGTENVPAIVGFAEALELAQKEKKEEKKRLHQLYNYLIKELLKIPESRLNGHPLQRASHIVSISFAGIEGEQLVRHLSEQGIFCSSGSACTSKKIEVSHVLKAMRVPERFARGTVRFSFGKGNTLQEMKKVANVVEEVVRTLRKAN